MIVDGVRGLFSLVGTKSSCSEVKIVRNRNDCKALISDTCASAICIWIDSSSCAVPPSKFVNSAIFDINKKLGKSVTDPLVPLGVIVTLPAANLKYGWNFNPDEISKSNSVLVKLVELVLSICCIGMSGCVKNIVSPLWETTNDPICDVCQGQPVIVCNNVVGSEISTILSFVLLNSNIYASFSSNTYASV